MTNWYQPTLEQIKTWDEWVKQRPPEIRAVAERFFPWKLYWLDPPGQRVTIYSFHEGNPITMCVSVLGEFNFVTHERTVFGVNPEHLSECNLPKPGELVGSLGLPIEMIKAIHMERTAHERN